MEEFLVIYWARAVGKLNSSLFVFFILSLACLAAIEF